MRRAVVAALAGAALVAPATAEAKPAAKRCGAAWTKPSKYRPLLARRCAKRATRLVASPGAATGAAPTTPQTAATAAPEQAGATPAQPACDPSPWLGAIAEDVGGFRLRLTRTCVPAGRVLVNFRNRDLQPHNLYAAGISPLVAPKRVLADVDGEQNADGEVTLTAGEWRLYCAIDGHEAMTRRLDVSG